MVDQRTDTAFLLITYHVTSLPVEFKQLVSIRVVVVADFC